MKNFRKKEAISLRESKQRKTEKLKDKELVLVGKMTDHAFREKWHGVEAHSVGIKVMRKNSRIQYAKDAAAQECGYDDYYQIECLEIALIKLNSI